ncbi:MAG: universal stress protein [Halodesulfurarchaeum sp.]
MYDRIVIAVDSSPEAEHAARTGIEMAAALGVPVDVINVLSRSILDVLRSKPDRDAVREERMALLADIEAMATERGVRATTALLEGTPSSEIPEFAAENASNPLVVLGRQGLSTVSERFLGGVTERVLKRGDTPVLVDPGTERGSAAEFSSILVPTDGSGNAELARSQADELAGEYAATVHLLSVVDLQRAGGVFDAGGVDPEFVERLESRAEEAVDAAREHLLATDPNRSVETAVVRTADFEGVSGAIAAYVEREGIDLVVMGSHGHSNVTRQLLGSVTSTVLRSIDVPVLIVPRGYAP